MSNANEISITDTKYLAIWDLQTEVNINKLFQKIKAEPMFSPQRKELVRLYFEILERKYNDKTSIDKRLCPLEVGIAKDIVTNQGLRQIGLWATGQSFAIFDRVLAGDGTATALFGDSNLSNERARVNINAAGIGFLDAFDNGWTISASFPRGTVSFTVAETGTATSTNFLFDRSVFSVADRKVHVQNQDSFTITNMFVLTSI